jgi:hypothetical protein
MNPSTKLTCEYTAGVVWCAYYKQVQPDGLQCPLTCFYSQVRLDDEKKEEQSKLEKKVSDDQK